MVSKAVFIDLTLNGASIGLMYSLIALGFVLVYKATDAINFAQGEFVMMAGLIAASILGLEGAWVLAAVVVTLATTLIAAVLLPTGRAPHDGGVPLPVLMDPYGGLADLGHRELRFLHPHSLRDDPTRLIRAARYGARLGFRLAPESVLQVRQTLVDWPWPWAPQEIGRASCRERV